MRAVWRACRWLDRPDNRMHAAEILSRPDYLNLPPELSERGLMGRLHVSARARCGRSRLHPVSRRGREFPWRSLAALFATRIAGRTGWTSRRRWQQAMGLFPHRPVPPAPAQRGADLPGASARVEGAMRIRRPSPRKRGR
jgi:two-component system, oxyanion-binding sensor